MDTIQFNGDGRRQMVPLNAAAPGFLNMIRVAPEESKSGQINVTTASAPTARVSLFIRCLMSSDLRVAVAAHPNRQRRFHAKP